MELNMRKTEYGMRFVPLPHTQLQVQWKLKTADIREIGKPKTSSFLKKLFISCLFATVIIRNVEKVILGFQEGRLSQQLHILKK